MKRMRSGLTMAALLAGGGGWSYAASVQGQLTCGDGKSPASGIAVTVNNASDGRSSPSFTGGDGMYYFNLKAGTYTLEIWLSRSSSTPSQTETITVTEPSTDIRSIVLPSCKAQ
jgi:hypothetical protein